MAKKDSINNLNPVQQQEDWQRALKKAQKQAADVKLAEKQKIKTASQAPATATQPKKNKQIIQESPPEPEATAPEEEAPTYDLSEEAPKKEFQPAGGSAPDPRELAKEKEDLRKKTPQPEKEGIGASIQRARQEADLYRRELEKQKKLAQEKKKTQTTTNKPSTTTMSSLESNSPAGYGLKLLKRLAKIFSSIVFAIATVIRIVLYLYGEIIIVPILDGILGEEMTDKIMATAYLTIQGCFYGCLLLIIIIFAGTFFGFWGGIFSFLFL